MKLTDAQIELLREVQAGDDRCVDTYKPAIRLVEKGLCYWDSTSGLSNSRLALTDAGRQALKEMEDKP